MDDILRDSNAIIETEVRNRAKEVEDLTGANLLTYSGPIDDAGQQILKLAVESIKPRRRRIMVNLETNGGLVESAERIAHTLRHFYRTVDFVVTTYAMSAGTVLVMSGDNIFMDYSATLGGLPRVRLTLFTPGSVGREGCPDAQEVPS